MNSYIKRLNLTGKERPKRFLFLFSDTGGGHRASARAVKDEFARLYGARAAIDMVDVFVETERWPFDRFPKWYPTLVGLNGIPWGVGFHLSDRVRVVRTMSRLVWPYARSPFCQLLRQYPADVIVSFHGVPNYLLFLARQQMGLQKPIAIVTLDLVTAHAGWFVPGAEMYLVPTEEARERALRWGVREQRVAVTGMPTRRCFVEALLLSQRAARQQLRLPQAVPVVLMVGGGDGMGPLVQVARAIAERSPKAHLVVITGRNEGLARELRALTLPVPVQVEGFVNNMEVWMRAASILVTKAGPNTISEAFIAGLPLVLYTALPGQEEGNVSHVIDNHAGIWAPHPDKAADAVLYLLSNAQVHTQMAARSQALAYPEATENIARKLWELGTQPFSPAPFVDVDWRARLRLFDRGISMF